MTILIQPLAPGDWESVRAIYCEGIATGNATFETEPPDWPLWDQKHLPEVRLVAKEEGAVVGWVALSPVSSRWVYRGVAEVSIYIAAAARGRGVGRALLGAAILASERLGIWTLQASIFPENVASLTLHERCGFRRVGVRERLGQMNGVWRDVVLMERRSRVAGL